VVYRFVRLPLVSDTVNGNHPYPSLDPETSVQRYFTAAFYVSLVAVTIGTVAAGVLWISR